MNSRPSSVGPPSPPSVAAGSPMPGNNGAGSTGCRETSHEHEAGAKCHRTTGVARRATHRRCVVKRTLILGKESKDVELLHQDGITTLVWEGQSLSLIH